MTRNLFIYICRTCTGGREKCPINPYTCKSSELQETKRYKNLYTDQPASINYCNPQGLTRQYTKLKTKNTDFRNLPLSTLSKIILEELFQNSSFILDTQ